MQPTELDPAFLIPIHQMHMHMHMHVLVKLCHKHLGTCVHAQNERQRQYGVDTIHTFQSLLIEKKQCFCIYGRCIWGIIGCIDRYKDLKKKNNYHRAAQQLRAEKRIIKMETNQIWNPTQTTATL